MHNSMSFMSGFSDTAYYSVPVPSGCEGGDAPGMTFGVLCAVRRGAAHETIQRIWGNWEDANDTGWCVQTAGVSLETAAGQIFDTEFGAAGNTLSNAPPAEPQTALYQPLFIVGVIDGAFTHYMYINGAEVAENSESNGTAGAEDVHLGRGVEANVPAIDTKVCMCFMETSGLSATQVSTLWHQIERYGRLLDTSSIDYHWDLIDNKNAGATWTSRGAAATPAVLTRAGVDAADLTVESWGNSSFGF